MKRALRFASSFVPVIAVALIALGAEKIATLPAFSPADAGKVATVGPSGSNVVWQAPSTTATPTGPAGGDLAANYPNPHVVGLNGSAIQIAPATLIERNAANTGWQTVTLPTGTTSGDLCAWSGTAGTGITDSGIPSANLVLVSRAINAGTGITVGPQSQLTSDITVSMSTIDNQPLTVGGTLTAANGITIANGFLNFTSTTNAANSAQFPNGMTDAFALRSQNGPMMHFDTTYQGIVFDAGVVTYNPSGAILTDNGGTTAMQFLSGGGLVAYQGNLKLGNGIANGAQMTFNGVTDNTWNLGGNGIMMPSGKIYGFGFYSADLTQSPLLYFKTSAGGDNRQCCGNQWVVHIPTTTNFDNANVAGIATLNAGSTTTGTISLTGTPQPLISISRPSNADGANAYSSISGFDNDYARFYRDNSQDHMEFYGVAANVAAPTGFKGEYQSNCVTAASGATITNNTTANVAAGLTLTAGDWEVWSTCAISGATTGTSFQCGVSTTSATMPAASLKGDTWDETPTMPTASADSTLNSPRMRSLSTSSITAYPVINVSFSGGSPAAYGCIKARRMR